MAPLRNAVLGLAVSALALLAVASKPALAQAAPTFEQILEGAKKEGAIVVWGTSPSQQATYKALFEAFNKRFGLDLKAEFIGINGARARPRIIAEAAAGVVSVDIVAGESADGAMLVARAGLAKPFPWVQVFGKELPQIGEALFPVPELSELALTYLDGLSGIAWNTKLVKDEDVPDTWEGLTDPKLRGKFGMNALLLTPLDQTAYARGVPETFDLAKKLLANRPRLENGTPAVSVAITAGTVAMGVSGFHGAERAIANGEPQKFKFFSDYIPHSPLCVYVVEKSRNPNAARLYAAWFVTEGIAVANQHEPVPSLRDPNSKLSKLLKEHVEKTGAKVSKPTSVKGIDEIMALREELQVLLTSQTGR